MVRLEKRKGIHKYYSPRHISNEMKMDRTTTHHHHHHQIVNIPNEKAKASTFMNKKKEINLFSIYCSVRC